MSSVESAGVLSSAPQWEQAVEWFIIIQGQGMPSNEKLQEWLQWMASDPQNRATFEAVAQTWHGTPASTALPEPTADELRLDTYDGEQSVEVWLASHAPSQGLSAATRAPRRRFSASYRLGWLAAACIVTAVFGFLVLNQSIGFRGTQTATFGTAAGEQIEVTLTDGSRVWIGPKSVLQVDISKDQRDLQLTAGEAYFSVKSNHRWPFVVNSVGGAITAVGTAFNVRTVEKQITVSVSEGVVTVAPQGQTQVTKPPAVKVASGQQLTFTALEPIQELTVSSSPSTGERSNWRKGVLVYNDEPLRDVVMDVARYSADEQLEISSEIVGDMPYTGVVNASAIDEWITALPISFPVKIISQGNRRIIAAR